MGVLKESFDVVSFEVEEGEVALGTCVIALHWNSSKNFNKQGGTIVYLLQNERHPSYG